ncbi:YfbK domain-containing protein [Rubellimicrobium arenae]|uniref:YfbK domain-containing protein n=1 Tax=Rubellimicrobium arenae TaxID=2817372 RepID=UPI001B3034CC|nr:YfbK domain-containing protein [Rubellimicrobium arenae]
MRGEDAALHEVRRDGHDAGTLRLLWKEPDQGSSLLSELPIRATGPVSSEGRFAVAIAGFGQFLRGSPSVAGWSWDEAIALARANRRTGSPMIRARR